MEQLIDGIIALHERILSGALDDRFAWRQGGFIQPNDQDKTFVSWCLSGEVIILTTKSRRIQLATLMLMALLAALGCGELMRYGFD